MMVRNAQLTLIKGKESVQAFMGWVNSVRIDTHVFFLSDTQSDTRSDRRVSLFPTELARLSAIKQRAQQREVIIL